MVFGLIIQWTPTDWRLRILLFFFFFSFHFNEYFLSFSSSSVTHCKCWWNSPWDVSSSYLNLRALLRCCLGNCQSNHRWETTIFKVYSTTWRSLPISYVGNLNQLKSYLYILWESLMLDWVYSGLSFQSLFLPLFFLKYSLNFSLFLPEEYWSSDMFTLLLSCSCTDCSVRALHSGRTYA